MSEHYLKSRELAERLGMSEWALRLWRLTGRGPAYVRLGRHTVRYPRAALEVWLEERTVRAGEGEALARRERAERLERLRRG